MRLARLGCLVAEAVNEFLDMSALGFLLGALAGDLFQPDTSGFLEPVIAAGIEGQLAAFQVKNFADNPVEQAAVMADQQDRTVIAPQVILKPQAGFEIEMVGRFVQQQQVGLGEQQRCQRYPHAPAARKFIARLLLILLGKSKPGKKAGGPRRRALRPFVV